MQPPPYGGEPPTEPIGPTPEIPGKPPWKRRWVRVTSVAVGTFIVAAVAVGVATSGSHVTKTAPTGPTATATAAPPPQQTDPAGATCVFLDDQGYCPGDDPSPSPSPTDDLTGPVGTTFTITSTTDGTSYDVTATRVLSHARGSDEFETPDAGNYFVGVRFKITGGSGFSKDDANNDAAVMGSDGQVYEPDFSSLAAGTNFNSGEFKVSAGQTQIGWVTFQLPQGVKVSSVQWSPDSGLSDQPPATWTVIS